MKIIDRSFSYFSEIFRGTVFLQQSSWLFAEVSKVYQDLSWPALVNCTRDNATKRVAITWNRLTFDFESWVWEKLFVELACHFLVIFFFAGWEERSIAIRVRISLWDFRVHRVYHQPSVRTIREWNNYIVIYR